MMAEGGIDSEDFLRYAAEDSGNVARDGNFSIQARRSRMASGRVPDNLGSVCLLRRREFLRRATFPSEAERTSCLHLTRMSRFRGTQVLTLALATRNMTANRLNSTDPEARAQARDAVVSSLSRNGCADHQLPAGTGGYGGEQSSRGARLHLQPRPPLVRRKRTNNVRFTKQNQAVPVNGGSPPSQPASSCSPLPQVHNRADRQQLARSPAPSSLALPPGLSPRRRDAAGRLLSRSLGLWCEVAGTCSSPRRWNCNSLNPGPEHVTDTYLSVLLHQLRMEARASRAPLQENAPHTNGKCKPEASNPFFPLLLRPSARAELHHLFRPLRRGVAQQPHVSRGHAKGQVVDARGGGDGGGGVPQGQGGGPEPHGG